VGLIVSEPKSFKEIEKLYIEIKWNGESEWNDYAFKIHGLSKEYLEDNGVDEEDAAAQIVELIMRHFDTNKAIVLCGHNVASFDKFFLKSLLRKFGIELKFSHRAIDSFPIGLITVQAYDSDELFSKMELSERKKHNSLEDIEYTLKSIRMINKLVNRCLDSE
jgi:DNA polymerase III epsilon subunit-like protein